MDEPQKYNGQVGLLKELLGKCPVSSNKALIVSQFEKDEMKWMLATLDGFGALRDFRAAVAAVAAMADSAANSKEKKKLFEGMIRAAKLVHMCVDRCNALEPDLPTEVLGTCKCVSAWSITPMMEEALQLYDFSDAVSVHATSLLNGLAEAQRAVATATRDMHKPDSESSWKNGLTDSSSVTDVLQLAQAEDSLTSVDGTVVETCIAKFQEAGSCQHQSVNTQYLHFFLLWGEGQPNPMREGERDN